MKHTLRILLTLLVAAIALAVSAIPAQAQESTVPCKAAVCLFVLDWGSGRTSSSFPPDRRYGSGDDFETKFRSAMGSRGYRLTDKPTEGAMTLTIRPTMKSRVMCDAMAGTNTDMSCTAVTNLAVSFTSGDPKVKAPGGVRITNRCGAGDIYLLNKDFAQYSADMIWYQLEGQAAKADRPNGNC